MRTRLRNLIKIQFDMEDIAIFFNFKDLLVLKSFIQSKNKRKFDFDAGVQSVLHMLG